MPGCSSVWAGSCTPGWTGIRGSWPACWGGVFLSRLLSALRWPKALAAATATPPTPGPILKLSARRLATRRRAGRTACRGTVTPWGRLFFWGRLSGARLPILRFPALAPSARILAVYRYAFEVGGVFLLLHEIGDIEKRIALQSQVDESRLHPGKHPGDTAFVNGARESVFVLPLVIDLCELVVFKDGQTRFMWRTGNTNFF